MAKKRLTEADVLAKQGAARRTFVGGPRDATKLLMQLKPLRYMRFAFPEWCTYEWSATEGAYLYLGPGAPPKDDAEEGPRRVAVEPYIPDPGPAEFYRQTEAYRRGRALASEVVV